MTLCKQISAHQGRKHIVTWVDTPERIKAGYAIELKGQDGLWFIDDIYDVCVERSDINRTWRVGGL